MTIGIGKLVFVILVPWFSVLGFQNSQNYWGNYAYKMPPLVVTEGVSPENLPKSLKIGSTDYWLWQEEAAIKQIKQMESAGFDGVFIDLAPRPGLYKKDLYNDLDIQTHPTEFFKLFGVWLNAAKKVSTKFKIGIFLESIHKTSEEPYGRIPSVDEWVSIIEKILSVYGNHPNLIKIDDKPCIVNFATSTLRIEGADPLDWSGGWKDVIGRLGADGKSFYFVSDIRPREEKLGALDKWANLSNALHIFAPAAPMSFGTEYQERISELVREKGGQYWWSVYPGYYRKKRDFSPPNFERIHELWMGAIQSQSNVVQILTWNDLSERTDIWPSGLNGNVLLDLMGFYAKWFKNRIMPDLNKDKIFLACPMRVCKNISAVTPDWPGYRKDPTNYNACYYWGLVQRSNFVDLSIPTIGNVRLNKGLSYGVLGEIKQQGTLQVKVVAGRKSYQTTTRKIRVCAESGEELAYFYVDLLPN